MSAAKKLRKECSKISCGLAVKSATGKLIEVFNEEDYQEPPEYNWEIMELDAYQCVEDLGEGFTVHRILTGKTEAKEHKPGLSS